MIFAGSAVEGTCRPAALAGYGGEYVSARFVIGGSGLPSGLITGAES